VSENALYTRGRALISEKLAQYKTGVVIYVHPGAKSGAAYNPTFAASTSYTLDAAVQGVHKRYIDGKLVIASDKMITSAVFAITPTMEGHVTVDGKRMEIVKIENLPAGGNPLAIVLIVRG